ncbi:major facilitator superfamily domain-containing protein [Boeremia exigua]|uniref:major facilitator superfamily domain-containing protein n=1 Tax=Boeremia exigua TaxID=749465 RepID=UPI001E8E2EF8|nr:major facilitator superfamily domain-containing protein [Boeremia exigua]KAH6611797.1 major facilitator superfamily domain-containing protein [Boeremia exigua]
MNIEAAPDAGVRAWMQVFCAWLAILNTWGFVNAFGAFQAYYTSVLPESPSAISWIGSTQACLMFAVGTFSGYALDAGLFRTTILLGISLQLLGIFTMSVAKTYWQLLLTQGICTGLGGGIFFVPVMGLVSTYFAKKRGLALGLVTTGTSAGGLIYPVVVQQLIDKVGFAWTVRVLGFMNLLSLAIVIALMRPRLAPRPRAPLIDKTALRDVPYILHSLGLCMLMPPVYFVFYYVASFARDELGMSYTASLNLVIILNGVGLPARVIPGYVADRCIGVLNTFALCLVANVVILWCWLAVKSIPAYYAYIVVYGLSAASFQSLFSTTIAAYCHDIANIGTRLGMAFTGMGVATLVGGPISGALLKMGGSYVAPICWNAALMVVGTGLVVAARVWEHGWGLATVC